MGSRLTALKARDHEDHVIAGIDSVKGYLEIPAVLLARETAGDSGTD